MELPGRAETAKHPVCNEITAVIGCDLYAEAVDLVYLYMVMA